MKREARHELAHVSAHSDPPGGWNRQAAPQRFIPPPVPPPLKTKLPQTVMPTFTPITPAGTFCTWLAANTEAQAWANLLRDAAHMPYGTKEGFQARGYEVVQTTKRGGVPALPPQNRS